MTTYYITKEQTEQLANLAKEHNANVDKYINVTLKEHFGGDTINMGQWFEAQRLIKGQNFYEKGHSILLVIRAFGIDCKMDMQSDKLHCPEIGVRAY